MSYLRITVAGLMIYWLAGCGDGQVGKERVPPCTADWYVLIENAVNTGDGQGHGPDPGSAEWRSVIEFKLGIRGNADVPPKDTAAWCDYIDALVDEAG